MTATGQTSGLTAQDRFTDQHHFGHDRGTVTQPGGGWQQRNLYDQLWFYHRYQPR